MTRLPQNISTQNLASVLGSLPSQQAMSVPPLLNSAMVISAPNFLSSGGKASPSTVAFNIAFKPAVLSSLTEKSSKPGTLQAIISTLKPLTATSTTTTVTTTRLV